MQLTFLFSVHALKGRGRRVSGYVGIGLSVESNRAPQVALGERSATVPQVARDDLGCVDEHRAAWLFQRPSSGSGI